MVLHCPLNINSRNKDSYAILSARWHSYKWSSSCQTDPHRRSDTSLDRTPWRPSNRDTVWCCIGLCIDSPGTGSGNRSCIGKTSRRSSAHQCTDTSRRKADLDDRMEWSCTRGCCWSPSSTEFCGSASTTSDVSSSSCEGACNPVLIPRSEYPLPLFAQTGTPINKKWWFLKIVHKKIYVPRSFFSSNQINYSTLIVIPLPLSNY